MDSFIFSVNSTVPVFLVILIGYFLRRINLLNDEFVKVCNKFNFVVTLPVMLFRDISETDIINDFDLSYVLFCMISVSIAFFAIWFFAKLALKDKSSVGAFVQASYRSSAAVLGAAFIMNMYGNTGMAPLMIIGSVPLFNIYAVIVLTLESSEISGAERKEKIRKAFLGVIKNPIIISIFLGIIASLLQIHFPTIIDKTLSSISALASPLALIAVGAGFKFTKTIKKFKTVMASAAIKLVILPLFIISSAVFLGFTDEKLVALIIMAGSPTTPSSYIMAENMHGDGVLTTGCIMFTTLCSTITLTFWIFICKYLGLIA